METFFQAALASASPVADVRLMDIPKSIPSAEKFALQFLLSPSDCSQKHLVIHDCEFGDSFYQTAIDTFVKGRPFKLLRLYDCSVSTEEFTKIVDFLESCPQNECSINVDVTSIDDLQSLLTDRGYKKELGVSLLTDDKTETYTLIRSEKYEVFIDFLHGYIGVSFYYRKREIPCDQRKVEETQMADKIFTVCPEN
ncbi:hypothetical protein L596_020052 [Steinernema carpocapsae]|uniref:Uncharacterized protein n=1 Tax=Steinernema carpocapsae TaxID=34508 RepID=A0A4U5MSI5_STECR|nr:hypothetical protein L596_020052 [Steinernema carpocapsae]